MLENYSARRGVNIPVISFVTRKLICGYKDDFTRRISKELGVKITAKSSQGHHINIKGEHPERVEAAKELIVQLDQKAAIIADSNLLTTTSSIDRTAYGLVGVHLTSLLETAKRNLPPLPFYEFGLESELSPEDRAYVSAPKVTTTVAPKEATLPTPPVIAEEDSGEWKPKPRTLSIKFNTPYFLPRNLSQALTYLACKDELNSYVYAAGPFGGGKTYTPLRAAFESYNESRVDEVIIIRPTTSTGRDPGAMPGDARRKQDPYLKGGIASNIEKMLVKLKMSELEKAKVVRAFTPDFERGETYDHAFILVDEPQNLTMQQAELLIGRLGEGSIMVFAGDIGGKQNDLKGQVSGLVHLIATQASATKHDDVLRKATAFIQFKDEDSAARNKILPHVSKALNNPPDAYAAFMRTMLEVRRDAEMAKAIEGAREFAVDELSTAGLNTLVRYEKRIRDDFSDIYRGNREVFTNHRPELKAV